MPASVVPVSAGWFRGWLAPRRAALPPGLAAAIAEEVASIGRAADLAALAADPRLARDVGLEPVVERHAAAEARRR